MQLVLSPMSPKGLSWIGEEVGWEVVGWHAMGGGCSLEDICGLDRCISHVVSHICFVSPVVYSTYIMQRVVVVQNGSLQTNFSAVSRLRGVCKLGGRQHN